jgi:pimeloyl-ACP methyl ester carboxylesterase
MTKDITKDRAKEVTWIFLRGLTREARHWGSHFGGFMAQFEAQLAPGKVTALDLPGNGEFSAQTSSLTVQAMAEFARQQLQAQGIKPPYQLLAMSLGGMVASHWAQSYPTEVTGMVLINTSMRPFSVVTERLRPGNWLPLLGLAARWDDIDYAERSVHRLTCNQINQRDTDLVAWRQIRRSAPVSSGNAFRQLLAAARFACAPQTPRCPVLVLSSKGDRLVNPVCSAQLATAWQARQHVHPWAGHDLPHDDASWVCERVVEWQILLNQ